MTLVPKAYVQIYDSRRKQFSYYRRGGYRARIPGVIGSPEWHTAYEVIHQAYEAASGKALAATPRTGSLAALITRYRSAPEWRGLAAATRLDYEKGLAVLAQYDTALIATLRRDHVHRIRAKAAEVSPSRANKAVTMLSILLGYAVEIGWRRDNPAAGIAKLKTGGQGYRAWSPEEVNTFLDAADPFWRRALLLALCTGQRGQDQVTMTRASYDGSAIQVQQLKTEARVWVPCHPSLKAELDAHGRDDLLLLSRNGKPWPLNAFQKAAGQAIRAAGLKGLVWHGLRTTAATWLAEAGCSEREIMSITGHTTAKMVQHYTRGAEQKRLATAAIAKFRLRHENE